MEEHTKRVMMICIVMLIIWGSIFILFWFKADEVTRHPCSVCANKMGETVMCSTGTSVISRQTFYPNGSIDTFVPTQP